MFRFEDVLAVRKDLVAILHTTAGKLHGLDLQTQVDFS